MPDVVCNGKEVLRITKSISMFSLCYLKTSGVSLQISLVKISIIYNSVFGYQGIYI